MVVGGEEKCQEMAGVLKTLKSLAKEGNCVPYLRFPDDNGGNIGRLVYCIEIDSLCWLYGVLHRNGHTEDNASIIAMSIGV